MMCWSLSALDCWSIKKTYIIPNAQVSQMLPERFAEQHIRVYCKSRDPDDVNNAYRSFKSWCRKKNYAVKVCIGLETYNISI